MSELARPEAICPARIAYVDHASEIGGAEKSLADLILRLDRSRFAPVVLCPEAAEWVSELLTANVPIRPAFHSAGVLELRRDDLAEGSHGRVRAALQAAPVVWRLWRCLTAVRPHIVHTNTLKTHLLGGAAARLAGRPLLWHLRDILEPGGGLDLLRSTAQRLRPRVIAISEAVRRSLAELDVDVSVIYNGIDLTKFRPLPNRDALRANLGLTPADIAIIVVGRLTPWKGHRELLRAIAELAPEEANIQLLVVGEIAFWEDDYEVELRELADSLGVSERVRWLGFRSDIPELLSASDIFALPSVNEPFGRALVEAMAVELPVVANRSGGAPEVVADGETGLLVRPGDHKELAVALLRLARNPKLRHSMGKAARTRAARLFDANRTAQQIQAIYEQVLSAG